MRPPEGGSVKSPFGAFATGVTVWELVSVVTQDLQESGRLDWRLPYITEIVRALPLPGRIMFVISVSVVLWEHLEWMQLTRLVMQRLARKAPAR